MTTCGTILDFFFYPGVKLITLSEVLCARIWRIQRDDARIIYATRRQSIRRVCVCGGG